MCDLFSVFFFSTAVSWREKPCRRFVVHMEETVWVTAFYEFGGVMHVSLTRLKALPLFKHGTPPELHLDHVPHSSSKKRRTGTNAIVLPYVQDPSEFYDLIHRHRYGTQPTSPTGRLCEFYESTELPDDFRTGCIDVQLEGEESPFHMSRHLLSTLCYFRGKSEFHSGLASVEYMPGVRRDVLKLLLFDDGRELDEPESREYYEAFAFYTAATPTIVIVEKDDLRLAQACRPLDQRTDARETQIRETVAQLLVRHDIQEHFAEATSTLAPCRCLLGFYALKTSRPRRTVRVDIYITDEYGQRNSLNTVYSFQYIQTHNNRAGSTLVVSVDDIETIKV